MPRLTGAALSLACLAACATPAPPSAGFRAVGVPIYSNATMDPAVLAGVWQQAATFGAACTPGRVEIGSDLRLSGRLCLDGRVVPVSGVLRAVGPGRVQLSGADPGGIGAPWWVLWIDSGARTLAIGTPSGIFGFVLNRGGPLPEDRFRAAAELFDFNGYETGRLTRLP